MARAQISDHKPTAFVDESIRPGDEGLYAVAAVTVIDDLARAREAAQKIPPRKRRFHWKDEQSPQRFDMLELLVDLACGLWTYEAQPCPTSKQERARTKCLEGLLWDLQQLGVDQLVIESRGPAADRRDNRTIGHAWRCGQAGNDLVFEHRRPRDEPALWLPDALAGATAAALTGTSIYVRRLGVAHERRLIEL